MFTQYETLTCQMCNNSFSGRKPPEGAKDIMCPDCFNAITEKLITEFNDDIPASVIAEMSDGRGDV